MEIETSSNSFNVHSRIIRCLYLGHFLARWDSRMWEFSVALFMINIWPDSLILAATYGAIGSASTALLGPVVGQWVDRLTYVQVLRTWLVTQNISFVIAGSTVLVLLINSTLKSTNFTAFVFLLVLTNVAGAVGVLSTLAGTILIEREWVVVISEGHSESVLTNMNSIIRRIDLTCKLLAPVISGFIISFLSIKASAIIMAIWNTIAVWLEYWLFMSVYNGIPALNESSRSKNSRTPGSDPEKLSLMFENEESSAPVENESRERTPEWVLKAPFIGAWIVYLQQDVVLPGFALALLYFTVLSFGTLMTAALAWEGIPAYIIGIGRGINAVIGIGATVVYPILQSRISTLRTGLWSIWSQWTCLLVCVASSWIQARNVAAYVLMAGVAASRLGLWMFDLSVIQQMQDHVPDSDRCVVGGVQDSLQSLLDFLGYVMGILIDNPKDFWELTLLSFSAVTMAATIYTMYVYKLRKHIFHLEKIWIPLKISNWLQN